VTVHEPTAINLHDALANTHDVWSQQLVAVANGQLVKVAKGRGATAWHQHPDEDELFLVQSGRLEIQLRDRSVHLAAGDLCVVPAGVEHRTLAAEEAGFLIMGKSVTSNAAGGKLEQDDHSSATLTRYAAFAESSDGGNPAGVWVGDTLPTPDVMQQIAAEVGYSETAFVSPASGPTRTIRYYSPKAEVSFCGHATIATGVHLGLTEGAGTYQLATAVGTVPVTVGRRSERWEAALTSVAARHEQPTDELLHEALAALGWSADDLDLGIPPAKAFAGAWHLVLAVRSSDRLAALDYDFEALRYVMARNNLTTLQLVWRDDAGVFHSRNPFPVGGVVEDPATGAAAAALGGYLRDAGLLVPPTGFVILQGETMGRPSRLEVDVPLTGGIVVRGTATPMPPV
jgi:PhzF family phenazine biosynthesis protein